MPPAPVDSSLLYALAMARLIAPAIRWRVEGGVVTDRAGIRIQSLEDHWEPSYLVESGAPLSSRSCSVADLPQELEAAIRRAARRPILESGPFWRAAAKSLG
ncbi:MAG: hypothetical protein Q8P18_21420 [Pseudomonadota bacterium]|nr:hypothetical protein [Pseudomonadota bacterium]